MPTAQLRPSPPHTEVLTRAAWAGRFAIYDLVAADTDDSETGPLTIHQAAERGLHKELVRCAGTRGRVPAAAGACTPETLHAAGRAHHHHAQGPASSSAAARLSRAATRRLVERALDVDLDALDSYGRSPLMWSSELGHLSTVEALLELGADRRVQDSQRGRCGARSLCSCSTARSEGCSWAHSARVSPAC